MEINNQGDHATKEMRFEIFMAVAMKITVLYILRKNSTREGNESCMPNGRQSQQDARKQ
jgi:hypothetical protein